jgi:hypothetical protein
VGDCGGCFHKAGKERYSCACGRMFLLEELYYCAQGCQAAKCLYCVKEEIVSTYCQQCLENVSSAEVIPNKGRCGKCFVCPTCQSVAKIVANESACFLKCVHCSWDSSSFAIAPLPANLIQLLREQERGGPAAVLFKERLTQYGKAVDEAAAARARQQRAMVVKKTQSMLTGTPAKKKFFSLESAVESPVAAAAPSSVAAPLGSSPLDALARLDAEEEAKHKAQFVRPSQVPVVAASEKVDSESEQMVERQRLLTSTSKHCGTCDKLLVRLDVNPSNAMDANKNRIHVAAVFVLRVGMMSMSAKQMKVCLFVANPMKNVVLAELSPLAVGCRYTLAAPQAITAAAAPGRLPVKQLVNAALAKAEAETSSVRFGVVVTLRYEGVLGKQETKYTVKIN